MFHVLLALPAIAVFGTVAGTVLSVLSGLLVLAFIAELLFGFVFRMAKWLLWLPCVLGMAVLGILGAGLGVVPLTLMLVIRPCLRLGAAGGEVRGTSAALAVWPVFLRVYVFASGTERDRAGSSDYRHF